MKAMSQITADWLAQEGLAVTNGQVVLYKRVSPAFLSHVNMSNETKWPVGQIVTCSTWNPARHEAGPGKFHACSRPGHCDYFQMTTPYRYIAIQVKVEDLYVWPEPRINQHSVGFKSGLVLFECDRAGKELDAFSSPRHGNGFI
jgi:hypothetical protein